MEHTWHIPSVEFHKQETWNHVCTCKMPWNMRGICIMSVTYSTQVGRGVIDTYVLFSNSNNLTADVDLVEIILLEPHLDSLLMPCFSHCLQKYSAYHSLFTMCIFIFSIGPSKVRQPSYSEHQSPKPLNYR